MSIVFDYLWKHDNHTGTHVPFDVDVYCHTGSSHKEDKYTEMARDTIWRQI